MDSSKSSDRRAPSAGSIDSLKLTDRIRFRGHRGGVINMHRALARLVLGPLDLLTSALLILLFSFVWCISLPWLCRFWRFVLAFGIRILALRSEVGLSEHHVTSYIRLLVPYPRMVGVVPSVATWWWSAAIVLAIFVLSFFFTERFTPVTYLLRAVLIVQTSALIYFIWAPARFPHTPDSYMQGLMAYGIALISFVPLLFGLTYYIFDFGIGKKALLTAMTMIHLSLFLPVQILLQAFVLQKSVLFMPLLYIVFGLPVDVLIIIAFYSWAMSWSTKPIERT